MKAVNQTITGNEFANCLQAAVASYFDLELSRVPNFMLFSGKYWDSLNYFIMSLGYQLYGYVEGLPPKDGNYYIASVDFGDQYNHSHSVIWKDGEIIHDPHPTGANLNDKIVGYLDIRRINPDQKRF